jgi:hypothetical protein
MPEMWFMKIVYPQPIKPHSQFTADVPVWVSSVGLEWLYRFLLKFELLLKGDLDK